MQNLDNTATVHYWGDTSEWFWAFAQFIVISGSLLFIIRQIRLQASSHVIQSVSTLHTRWNSTTMLNARLDVCRRYKIGVSDFDGSADHIAEFMDELGTYMRFKAIPNVVLWEVQSWYVEHYWRMFESDIRKIRTNYHDNSLFSEFEYMYKQMRMISEKRRASLHERDDNELLQFMDAEIAKTQAIVAMGS